MYYTYTPMVYLKSFQLRPGGTNWLAQSKQRRRGAALSLSTEMGSLKGPLPHPAFDRAARRKKNQGAVVNRSSTATVVPETGGKGKEARQPA